MCVSKIQGRDTRTEDGKRLNWERVDLSMQVDRRTVTKNYGESEEVKLYVFWFVGVKGWGRPWRRQHGS